MEKLIFIGLGSVLLYLAYRNIVMYKRIKLNKTYVNLFNEIFKEDNENAYVQVVNYINETENVEFKNKGRIFQLYLALKENLPYEECLNALDFKELFYTNDKPDARKAGFNSDTFVWVIATMVKAYSKGHIDVIDELVAKLSIHQDLLNQYVEYTLVTNVAKCLKGEEERGVEFMSNLINGNYNEYKYDPRLIGFYKKMATTFLAYSGQELDEYQKEDIRNFATSLIGNFILHDLNLYDEYYVEYSDLENSEETLESDKEVQETIEESQKEETIETSSDDSETSEGNKE